LRPPDMPPDATDVNNPRSFSSLKTFWGAIPVVPEGLGCDDTTVLGIGAGTDG